MATIKSVLTNWRYLVLASVIGGAMAYISAQQISNEPILCSLGYSNSFSGASAGLVFLGGILGSIAFGLSFHRIPYLKDNIVITSKVMMLPLAVIMVGLIFLMQLPDMQVAIAAVYFAVGFFAIGLVLSLSIIFVSVNFFPHSMYPTMLEFSVETTYPNDEAVVTAIILVFSAIQGVIVIELQQFFASEYIPKEGIKVMPRIIF